MLLSTLSKCTADLHALAIPHDLLRRNQRMTDHDTGAETARKGCNPIRNAERPISLASLRDLPSRLLLDHSVFPKHRAGATKRRRGAIFYAAYECKDALRYRQMFGDRLRRGHKYLSKRAFALRYSVLPST